MSGLRCAYIKEPLCRRARRRAARARESLSTLFTCSVFGSHVYYQHVNATTMHQAARVCSARARAAARGMQHETQQSSRCVSQQSAQHAERGAAAQNWQAHGPTGSDMLTNKGLTRSTIHSLIVQGPQSRR